MLQLVRNAKTLGQDIPKPLKYTVPNTSSSRYDTQSNRNVLKYACFSSVLFTKRLPNNPLALRPPGEIIKLNFLH